LAIEHFFVIHVYLTRSTSGGAGFPTIGLPKLAVEYFRARQIITLSHPRKAVYQRQLGKGRLLSQPARNEAAAPFAHPDVGL
jgi:hypothetical protein